MRLLFISAVGGGVMLICCSGTTGAADSPLQVLALDPAPPPLAAPKAKAQAGPAALDGDEDASTPKEGKDRGQGKGKGRRVVPDADNPRVKGPHKDMVPMTPEEAAAKRLERKRAKKLAKEQGRSSAAERQLKNRLMQQIGNKRAVEAAGVTPFAGPSADAGEQDAPELVSRIKRYPLIDMDDFKRWILFENGSLLVLDKPGDVLCHPSKNGPMSSLVGVVKEYTKLPTVHLISRLDRVGGGRVGARVCISPTVGLCRSITIVVLRHWHRRCSVVL